MRTRILFSILLFVSTTLYPFPAPAQHGGHGEPPSPQARRFEGMGAVHHKVTTDSSEAQAYFDQGLALCYGFNHDEAGRSFQKAAELDPGMAMAYWGLAFTLGSNYNMPSFPDREKAAAEAMAKAVALAGKASASERDYIQALSRRYSKDPKADRKVLAEAYSQAMRELTVKYPDDLDAATLYAESLMNLRPWELWKKDGSPAPGTEIIVRVLESVLRRDPNHVGANHYYIHAVEASFTPERALPSADRLAQLAPAAGHLVHMPSHIYSRVGDHEAAARSNREAAAADEAYLAATRIEGVYPLMYANHNLHFLAYAYTMAGNYGEAIRAARKLEERVQPALKEMPMLEMFLPTEAFVLVRFRKWEEVLKLPAPESSLRYQTGIWHWARGMAFAELGQRKDAEKEREALAALIPTLPADHIVDKSPARALLGIAESKLAARMGRVAKDYVNAERRLEMAVKIQDNLNYIEPPEWFAPEREALGAVKLLAGKAAEAEEVFRKDLAMNPRNGRSLFGLMESLKAQGRNAEAEMVRTQFEAAWKNADVTLTIDQL
jgi:tetratricopeptide (TPR) repeat protein